MRAGPFAVARGRTDSKQGCANDSTDRILAL